MALIPIYILILAFTITIDYFSGIIIDTIQKKYKKLFLIISIISNVGILFIFKYFNFFNSSIESIANLLHWNYPLITLKLILPVGLSFHTFQSMSYIIEVYKGNQKPEKHFGIYALYVMFYPQLVAGPIERPQNMIHQFHEIHNFDFDRFSSGLKLIAFGLIKKIVIADRLAIVVNQVYNSPEKHNGLQILLATVFFSFQIYCDFSGYSDIAIGCAHTMGFKLMENFRRPYLATSVAGFWKRWHISLTSWFRDYIYIPLGGNRKRHYFNILFVFLLSGLWHGASVTFIIWGFLNGLYQLIGMKLKNIKGNIKRFIFKENNSVLQNIISRVITFIFISFAWIFFRVNNISNLKIILGKLFTFNEKFYSKVGISNLGMGRKEIIFSILLILILITIDFIMENHNVGSVVERKPFIFRWVIYSAIIAIILLFGVYGDANSSQFIYFQF